MKINIRLLYLYLFSFVGLLVTVIGSIRLVNLGLKVFVFPQADNYVYYRPAPAELTPRPSDGSQSALVRDDEKTDMLNQQTETARQRQREASEAMAMIIIGLPLYIYHWKTAQRENRKN